MNQQQDRNGELIQLSTVFRRRAQQLAQRGRQQTHRRAGAPFLVLKTAGERFGIELVNVQQVFPRLELTPVPGAPRALLGVANLNGLPRSVFDLGRLLNLPPSDSSAPYIVLLRACGTMMGLAVETVDEVRRCDTDKLMPVDEAADDAASRFTKGLTDDHVALLHADALLQHVRQNPAAQPGDANVLASASGKRDRD